MKKQRFLSYHATWYYNSSLILFSEIETFKEWLRYHYGVFSESGFEGDRIYPRQYGFAGETKDSYGCEHVASNPLMKPKEEDRGRKSFEADYKYDPISHVTVPFLPNNERNGDEPQLTLEEFTSTSFKVGA